MKKRLQQRHFLVKFAKFFRTPILKNICELLLLDFVLPVLSIIFLGWLMLTVNVVLKIEEQTV